MAGLLHVTVQSARAPLAADPSPLSSEPCLVLCVGGTSCYTSTAAVNIPDPAWQERCALFVR